MQACDSLKCHFICSDALKIAENGRTDSKNGRTNHASVRTNLLLINNCFIEKQANDEKVGKMLQIFERFLFAISQTPILNDTIKE